MNFILLNLEKLALLKCGMYNFNMFSVYTNLTSFQYEFN